MVAVSLAGCTETEDPCVPRAAVEVDPAGARHQYVVDTIQFATSVSGSDELGLDLDRDPRSIPDNTLGVVLSMFESLGDYDLNAEVQQVIDSGAILHLLELQTTSLDGAGNVGLRVLHGVDRDGDPTDNFTGTERFGIDASRGIGSLSGYIDDGYVVVDVGTVPLAVTLPGIEEPYVLELYGARIEATIGPDGLTGRIGGAISQSDLNTKLIPILADGLGRIVTRDCVDDPCDEASFGAALLDYFDDNLDGEISVAELRDSPLTSSLLAPDVDLLDDKGQLAPRCDGVKEGISIGVGFTAVPAIF